VLKVYWKLHSEEYISLDSTSLSFYFVFYFTQKVVDGVSANSAAGSRRFSFLIINSAAVVLSSTLISGLFLSVVYLLPIP